MQSLKQNLNFSIQQITYQLNEYNDCMPDTHESVDTENDITAFISTLNNSEYLKRKLLVANKIKTEIEQLNNTLQQISETIQTDINVYTDRLLQNRDAISTIDVSQYPPKKISEEETLFYIKAFTNRETLTTIYDSDTDSFTYTNLTCKLQSTKSNLLFTFEVTSSRIFGIVCTERSMSTSDMLYFKKQILFSKNGESPVKHWSFWEHCLHIKLSLVGSDDVEIRIGGWDENLCIKAPGRFQSIDNGYYQFFPYSMKDLYGTTDSRFSVERMCVYTFE